MSGLRLRGRPESVRQRSEEPVIHHRHRHPQTETSVYRSLSSPFNLNFFHLNPFSIHLHIQCLSLLFDHFFIRYQSSADSSLVTWLRLLFANGIAVSLNNKWKVCFFWLCLCSEQSFCAQLNTDFVLTVINSLLNSNTVLFFEIDFPKRKTSVRFVMFSLLAKEMSIICVSDVCSVSRLSTVCPKRVK